MEKATKIVRQNPARYTIGQKNVPSAHAPTGNRSDQASRHQQKNRLLPHQHRYPSRVLFLRRQVSPAGLSNASCYSPDSLDPLMLGEQWR